MLRLVKVDVVYLQVGQYGFGGQIGKGVSATVMPFGRNMFFCSRIFLNFGNPGHC